MIKKYSILWMVVSWVMLGVMQAMTVDIGIPLAEGRYDMGSFRKDAKIHTMYAYIEPDVTVSLFSDLSLSSHWVFEPIMPIENQMQAHTDTGWFYDHGLYIETLTLDYHTKKGTLFIGKFNPSFGQAFETGPGIWGRKGLPEAYESVEKLGFGGRVDKTVLGVDVVVESSLFKADTTPLQHSFISDRYSPNQVSRVSNTSGLESYAMSAKATHENEVSYYGAYQYLAQDRWSQYSEKGYVVGIQGVEDVDGIPVTRMLEYAKLVNHGGLASDASYLTMGASAINGRWTYAIAYTNLTQVGAHENQIQASLGYLFDNGVTLDWGVRHTHNKFNHNDGYVGMRVSIPFDNRQYDIPLAPMKRDGTRYNPFDKHDRVESVSSQADASSGSVVGKPSTNTGEFTGSSAVFESQ